MNVPASRIFIDRPRIFFAQDESRRDRGSRPEGHAGADKSRQEGEDEKWSKSEKNSHWFMPPIESRNASA